MAIQEVHGSLQRFRQAFSDIDFHFHILGSFGAPDCGGLVTIWPKGSWCSNDLSTSDIGCPGRILRTILIFAGFTVIHYNLHLEALSVADLRRLATALDRDWSFTLVDRDHRFMYVCGDLNSLAAGSRRLSLIDPASIAVSTGEKTSLRGVFGTLR